jgi:alkaline phosphatase D
MGPFSSRKDTTTRQTRRQFLRDAAIVAAAPAIVVADAARPQLPSGVASGDVTSSGAVLWSRSDRPSRMVVEYATTESLRNPSRVAGPEARAGNDFITKLNLTGLPAGQRIFYRVTYHAGRTMSEPVTGSFQTAPAGPRAVSFVFSADTCGQGWGINPEWGGLRLYQAMLGVNPDFFIHSGDAIYADGPIPAEVITDDGRMWKNLTTEAKSKVAETLDEFRGNYAYNLMDEHMRRFNAAVPLLAQWDDHETRNNWYPGQILDDSRYREKNVNVLAARARRAFLDYHPIRASPADPQRIFRAYRYGPALEVFLLDERSYRGPNSANRQEAAGRDTDFLGTAQMAWLKQRLRTSQATWKVIASDMPVGLVVTDGPERFEAWANGDGPPLGRELELAGLLRFIKQNRIRNVVWITGDVHYCAAHYYDPAMAQFTDFDPFWEFVAGPLNAGTFGPGRLDNTFGPQVKFIGIPEGMKANRPPWDGFQFFGRAAIDAAGEAMRVSLHNLEGMELYAVTLERRRS